MSSFNGKPAEIQRLSIDRFDGDNLQSTCFMLSHCHTDHMEGILDPRFTSRLLDTPDVFLYCSDITATILKHSGLSSVSHKIIALSIEGSTIVRIPPSRQDDSCHDQEVVVTMIPAGHCPGSVMFLFELSCGNVLYTGDFRLTTGDVSKLRALHNADGHVKPVRSLYLDTTFVCALNGRGRTSFPSRADSADVLCRLIRDWLKQADDHVVNIKTSARYGSEYLFVAIAKELKIPVHVSRKHFQVYQQIPDIAHAVTWDPSTRIHACWDKDLSCPLVQNWSSKIRKIIPSALYWHGKSNLDVISESSGLKCRVAYSCHSSHDEIQHLVSYLKPDRIEPCVVPLSMTRADVVNVCNMFRDGYVDRSTSSVERDASLCNGVSSHDVQHCTTNTSDIQRLACNVQHCTTNTSDMQRQACNVQHCTTNTSDIQRLKMEACNVQHCTTDTSDIQRLKMEACNVQHCTTDSEEEDSSDSSRSTSPLACFPTAVDASRAMSVDCEDDSPISSPGRPSLQQVLPRRRLIQQNENTSSTALELATLSAPYETDNKTEKRNLLFIDADQLTKKFKTH